MELKLGFSFDMPLSNSLIGMYVQFDQIGAQLAPCSILWLSPGLPLLAVVMGILLMLARLLIFSTKMRLEQVHLDQLFL